MEIVRLIDREERVVDIIEEVKRLTFVTNREYAIVRLKDGTRAIVTGEADSIDLPIGLTVRLFGHSHPYSLPATGFASDEDREALRILGQRTSYILERGVLFKFAVE
ncbi:MAG: hypothetical protein KY476_02035 [Planctomycetes bacterium]|nr:hypothetical protein [Planctomycetota bacterium]